MGIFRQRPRLVLVALVVVTVLTLPAQADRGPGGWAIAGWVVAALAVLAAVWFMLRHRAADDDEDETDEEDLPAEEEKEPVGAGTPRVTSWSYRDRPEE